MLQRRRKWDIIIFLHISPLSFRLFPPPLFFLHFLFLFLAFSDSIPVYLLPFSLHPLTKANLYCFPVPFFLLSLSLYSHILSFTQSSIYFNLTLLVLLLYRGLLLSSLRAAGPERFSVSP